MSRRYPMAKQRMSIRFKLTPEQQEQIRQAIGQNAEALELSLEELEERIAAMPVHGGS
jgi:DNA-binding MarR family transcriptional regulator